jgi:nitroimidazol reductase NimA-like FMN-containing flavoprotein (pyridoxamine 5'-phosphate oxidase superfamily)
MSEQGTDSLTPAQQPAAEQDIGLMTLGESECWALVEANDVGRLAIIVNGRPEVFPVNYMAREGAVVFRTASGTKLEYGQGSHCCFEVDDWNDRTGAGWSVMVQGVLTDITDATDAQAESLRQLSVYPLAPGRHDHVVVLIADRVSGRRFRGDEIDRRYAFAGRMW